MVHLNNKPHAATHSDEILISVYGKVVIFSS